MKAHGITVHPTQLTAKLKEIGKDHDKTLLQWKSSIEQHQDTVLCLEIVKQCLQSLAYLPQLPDWTDWTAMFLLNDKWAE